MRIPVELKVSQGKVGKSGKSAQAGKSFPIFMVGINQKKLLLAKNLNRLPGGAIAEEIIGDLFKNETFTARAGATQVLRHTRWKETPQFGLLGLGEKADWSDAKFLEKMRVAGANLFARLRTEKLESFTLVPALLEDLRSPEETVATLKALLEGFAISAYDVDKETQAGVKSAFKISGQIQLEEKSLYSEIERACIEAMATQESVSITRDWSNLPSNVGTPDFYAKDAARICKQHGLSVRVMSEAECVREKMNLFVGVGLGSERETKLVIAEYRPGGKTGKTKSGPKSGQKNGKTIALVGKGVTFDSGGISIKPSMRMEDMKHDMTGAATVMGTLALCAKLNVPHHVVGVMAFTENMPDSMAIQPGNVIRSRSGKTVEIINTDAEGRLVLADALDLVQDYHKPDVVIDVATLTGAVSVALGKLSAGILGNNEGLIDQVRKAADRHGERLWPLPLHDEYFEDLKSDYADMKNSANDGHAGTIRGAIFLKQFIKKDTPWVHLDIAGTAYHMGHYAYFPKKGASGAFVRTLAQFVRDY